HFCTSSYSMLPPPPTSTLFPTRRSSDLSNTDRAGVSDAPGKAHRHQRLMFVVTIGLVFEAEVGFVEARGVADRPALMNPAAIEGDRKSTRLNSSHDQISYAVFCLKKKKN